MRWLLPLLILLSPTYLWGEEEEQLEVRSENGCHFDSATRKITWRGPCRITLGAWEIITSGDTTAHLDRVLRKKGEDFQVRPALRSIISHQPSELFFHDGQLAVKARHLVWLQEQKLFRILGAGSTIEKEGKIFQSGPAATDYATITLCGRVDYHGSWFSGEDP